MNGPPPKGHPANLTQLWEALESTWASIPVEWLTPCRVKALTNWGCSEGKRGVCNSMLFLMFSILSVLQRNSATLFISAILVIQKQNSWVRPATLQLNPNNIWWYLCWNTDKNGDLKVIQAEMQPVLILCLWGPCRLSLGLRLQVRWADSEPPWQVATVDGIVTCSLPNIQFDPFEYATTFHYCMSSTVRAMVEGGNNDKPWQGQLAVIDEGNRSFDGLLRKWVYLKTWCLTELIWCII
jgi:hypothetical protein